MVKQIVMMVFAALMAQCVWAEAPVPVVVFNGDLINGAHKNGKFAVSKRDADSQVTIANGFATLTKTQGSGAPQGVKIAWDEATMPGTQLTVLVKYSGFDKNSGRTALLSAEWGGYDVSVSHSYDKKLNAGYYTHGQVGDNAGTEGTASAAYDIPTSGIMMVAMDSQPGNAETRGTRVAFYDEASSALVEKWRWDGLRWQDATFKNILIGGTVGPQNHYYRPTMTVEAVAIFNKALTIAEANAYVFPTLHRITDVSGTKTWEELMEGRNFVNGDDVAIVMSGNSTITLPETPVVPGTFSVFGTGDMTIPAMNFPVVSGTQIIWARGFSGVTLTKEGTNRLRIQNGDNNGSSETYTNIALNGTTVDIVDGTVELCTGHNNDARFNDTTFNIGTYGDLDCYGWIYGKGTMTIENATDKTILTNRGGNNSNLQDVPTIVKKGDGKLTMMCNFAGDSSTSSTTSAEIEIKAGTLCLKNGSNKTLNGTISGDGTLEIDVGSSNTVTLGHASNTMAAVTVTSGTAVANAANAFGTGMLTVQDGAVATIVNNTTAYDVTLNGGTLKSDGVGDAHGKLVKSLTLGADSSFICTGTSGNKLIGIGQGGTATTLSLNTHTLTLTGKGTGRYDRVYLDNTSIQSAGTIHVTKGHLFLHCGSITAPEDTKIIIDANASIACDNKTLSVSELEYNGTVSVDSSDACMVTVTSKFSGTGSIPKLTLGNGVEVSGSATVTTAATASGTVKLTDGATLTVPTASFTANTVVSGVDTKKVATKTVEGKTVYGLVDKNPEPIKPTDGTGTFPEGTVITDADGEVVTTGNTLPTVTGVYTVQAMENGFPVGDPLSYGVVAAKAAETTTDLVTTAVAVPFKGKTVETLLNTALLAEGDTLMAWVTVGEKSGYATWKLTSGAWVGENVVNGIAAQPATTALKRGQAVWVTTAGKIVTFGDTAATGANVEITTGHNLLGSIAYTDATPTVAATEDQVQLIGEVDAKGNEIITRYNKTSTGWQSKIQKRTQLDNGKWVTTEETSTKAPTVKPGRGYWLIRK